MVALPRDAASGVREFSEIRTWLAGIGPWRATVTAYDWVYDAEALPAGHASGGALSMLWHSALGPVMLASVTEYGLVEPSNMQPPREGPPVPLTPRVELETGGVAYRGVDDLTARVSHQSGPDGIEFEIRGELKVASRRRPAMRSPSASRTTSATTASSCAPGRALHEARGWSSRWSARATSRPTASRAEWRSRSPAAASR